MNSEHFRLLERIYLGAPTNEYYEPSMAISEGRAVVGIAIKPVFFHAFGATHGSVYFKALDDAAYFAANSVRTDVFVVTASFQLYLLRPIASGTMTATGTVVSQSKRLIIAEAVATDDEGREIARGSGSFMPTAVAISQWQPPTAS